MDKNKGCLFDGNDIPFLCLFLSCYLVPVLSIQFSFYVVYHILLSCNSRLVLCLGKAMGRSAESLSGYLHSRLHQLFGIFLGLVTKGIKLTGYYQCIRKSLQFLRLCPIRGTQDIFGILFFSVAGIKNFRYLRGNGTLRIKLLEAGNPVSGPGNGNRLFPSP